MEARSLLQLRSVTIDPLRDRLPDLRVAPGSEPLLFVRRDIAGHTPSALELIGVDQTDFLLGTSDKSNPTPACSIGYVNAEEPSRSRTRGGGKAILNTATSLTGTVQRGSVKRWTSLPY